MKAARRRFGVLVGAAATLAATVSAGSAAAASDPIGQLTSQLQGQLEQITGNLPHLPQISQLPGASAIPDLSTVPGLPGVQGITNNPQNTVTDPAVGGAFSAPFAEPGNNCPFETQGNPTGVTKANIACKPAGVSVVVLPNGKLLYWDGLEGEENIKYSIVIEYGDIAGNDQSRVLDLKTAGSPSWTKPAPPDGGAKGHSMYLLPNAPGPLLKAVFNDQGPGSGALFCSDQVLLSNGEVLSPGGTDYYAEPRIPGTPFGVAELQGLTNTRIYNPRTNTWTQAGDMRYGRWYPSLVTLANGKVFVASGVTKLLKPVYTANPLLSGTNVEQTETFDPATGKWTTNPQSATHTLPLFPRLHLLPDGHVYYDAGGQTFNPAGQSYDEALWNIAASYDPKGQSWQYLGIPAGVSLDLARPLSTAITAGFRGSAASVMLPLKPPYNSASFLDAGGVLGTSPGVYLANSSSIIDTVRIDGSGEHFSSAPTPPLVNARWFSSTVMLPTGQAIAFNGANRDDVVGPGTSFPVTQAEMFDPAAGKWTALANSGDPRTYHNTAALLPSGQVLIGGNAPISTLYAYNTTLPGGFSNDFRDPSFQIYDPPYLKWGIAQPTITSVGPLGTNRDVSYGQAINVGALLAPQASGVASVVLVRNTALTHVVDGDQRSVELPFTVSGNTIHATAPPNGNVAPPGPYLLFVNEKTSKGLIPSAAEQVFVGPQAAPVPTRP